MDILLDPFRFKPTRQIASGLYPLYATDGLDLQLSALNAGTMTVFHDLLQLAVAPVACSVDVTIAFRSTGLLEHLDLAVSVQEASIIKVIDYRQLAGPIEGVDVGVSVLAAELTKVIGYVSYTNWAPDLMNVGVQPLAASIE